MKSIWWPKFADERKIKINFLIYIVVLKKGTRPIVSIPREYVKKMKLQTKDLKKRKKIKF